MLQTLPKPRTYFYHFHLHFVLVFCLKKNPKQNEEESEKTELPRHRIKDEQKSMVHRFYADFYIDCIPRPSFFGFVFIFLRTNNPGKTPIPLAARHAWKRLFICCYEPSYVACSMTPAVYDRHVLTLKMQYCSRLVFKPHMALSRRQYFYRFTNY